jgi:hypothetical protein
MPRDDEMALIRALLRTALAALPESPHTIEDALGIGHGTLLRLLDGRMELSCATCWSSAGFSRSIPATSSSAGSPTGRRPTGSTTGSLPIIGGLPNLSPSPRRFCKRSAPRFAKKSPSPA